MINVFIIDDSPTIRNILVDIIERDSELNVFGEAGNGIEGLSLIENKKPDVIILDIQMPKMGGFEFLENLMQSNPIPTIIVSASCDNNKSDNSIKGLALGAVSIISKPKRPGDDLFESNLKRSIKAFSGVKLVKRKISLNNYEEEKLDEYEKASEALKLGFSQNISAIAIGASTGGPEIIRSILGRLPSDYPLPILLVQHIGSDFTNSYVDWLDSVVSLKVKTAEIGERIKGGTVYLAPNDFHIGLENQNQIKLSKVDPIEGFRPSVNFMFDTMATVLGARGLGIILTGMGRDGRDGIVKMKKLEGITIAQDEKTSIVFGMPKEAILTGCVDKVLNPIEIGDVLLNLVKRS